MRVEINGIAYFIDFLSIEDTEDDDLGNIKIKYEDFDEWFCFPFTWLDLAPHWAEVEKFEIIIDLKITES